MNGNRAQSVGWTLPSGWPGGRRTIEVCEAEPEAVVEVASRSAHADASRLVAAAAGGADPGEISVAELARELGIGRSLIPQWIADANGAAPHSALDALTPRACRQRYASTSTPACRASSSTDGSSLQQQSSFVASPLLGPRALS